MCSRWLPSFTCIKGGKGKDFKGGQGKGGKKGDAKGNDGKGKGKPYVPYAPPGKGKGKHDSGGKGKGGQGKAGKKGDSKGRCNPSIVCWLCGKTGHPQLCWNIPNRKQVNQVEQTAGAAQSPAPSRVGPSASQHPAASTATTIRRVAGEALVFDFSEIASTLPGDARLARVACEGQRYRWRLSLIVVQI